MLSNNKLDKISRIEIEMHIPHNKLLAQQGYFHALQIKILYIKWVTIVHVFVIPR